MMVTKNGLHSLNFPDDFWEVRQSWHYEMSMRVSAFETITGGPQMATHASKVCPVHQGTRSSLC